jgi:hypothetical protein
MERRLCELQGGDAGRAERVSYGLAFACVVYTLLLSLLACCVDVHALLFLLFTFLHRALGFLCFFFFFRFLFLV